MYDIPTRDELFGAMTPFYLSGFNHRTVSREQQIQEKELLGNPKDKKIILIFTRNINMED